MKKLAAIILLLLLPIMAHAIVVGMGNTPVSSGATNVSDNFNRANGGLGANWTTASEAGAPQISGSIVTSSLGYYSAYWSANSFANNQFVSALIAPNDYAAGIKVRQSSSADTYYSLEAVSPTDGEGYLYMNVQIWKCVAGTRTPLGASYDDVFADGSTASAYFKLAISGTTLTPYKSTNGTSWTAMATRDGGSGIDSGSAGLMVNTSLSIDNWAGGDL